jgi:retinol-binding protein 3
MKFKFAILTVALGIVFCVPAARAQETGGKVDAAFRGETIESIAKLLKERYTYPEIAEKMEAELRMRQKRGDYDQVADGDEFAKMLTEHLRGVFDDKHMRVSYSAKPIPERSSANGAPTADEIRQARINQGRENFGVVKLEILPGNVGVMQINYFAPLDWARDTYTAAFNYLGNTDALIIDARWNRGSMDIETMPFFSGYLFDKPAEFGDIFVRERNEKRILMTAAEVPGKRYGNKPVFVLTSGRTASGAEAFVKAMQRLKRATIIGETTRGATMPGGTVRVNDHFAIWISTGRSATGTAQNENRGTPPDITVPVADALNEAHRHALDRLARSADAGWKEELTKIRAGLSSN